MEMEKAFKAELEHKEGANKIKYYLSSGFFTEETRKEVERVAKIFRDRGHEVYVPMEYLVPGGESMPHEEWAEAVFKKDVEEIDKCDKIILLDFGANGDCGTAWEAGYAYAKGIPVLVYAYGDDISLMITGCTEQIIKANHQEKLKLV